MDMLKPKVASSRTNLADLSEQIKQDAQERNPRARSPALQEGECNHSELPFL
jgi:hypothetical protein